MRSLTQLLVLLALVAPWQGGLLQAQARGDERGFTSAVSQRLIDEYSRRFGAPARGRLEAWKRYAAQRKGSPGAEAELLVEVNRTLNRIQFVDDQTHWGEADYWATPAESVASNGGDCEDFTIAKYFLLKELGVPISRLRMTYVKAIRLNQAHMVLAYYPKPDAEPLVLDNLEESVRPASQRRDLVPVYSFNDEEVWIEARGRSGSPKQIRNWNLLLERLDKEMRT
ncbi:MAG: transglutaminase-like cysteine peptidase [Betaproteobacteria bacterium]|nr:transglutaminase-like cysteine peptidase [Betaproteobacteria bacterium]